MASMRPLTTSQRDLYVDYSIRENRYLYNLGFCLPLGEGIDRNLWEESVRQVAESDDITRTRMIAGKGGIFQGVDSTVPSHFEYIDPTDGATPDKTPWEDLK